MSEPTREERRAARRAKRKDEKQELPGAWGQIHGAIWLIGLAILAWRGWWWPGILVLVALSGLAEAAIRLYLSRTEAEHTLQQTRAAALPATCPNCGSPLSVDSVRWTGPTTAICSFCGSQVQAETT